jgi:hypothetical protein
MLSLLGSFEGKIVFLPDNNSFIKFMDISVLALVVIFFTIRQLGPHIWIWSRIAAAVTHKIGDLKIIISRFLKS